jgi:TrmH family RNA methyltransferase
VQYPRRAAGLLGEFKAYKRTVVNQITSSQNPRIKEVSRLSRRAIRDERRLTVVEGLRETSRALNSAITPVEAYICPVLATGDKAKELAFIIRRLESAGVANLFEVTPEVFARLAYREGSDGLLLVIPYLDRTLTEIPLSAPPFLCIVEGVEKPGNLGAILRTADAAGVDGVIVCTGATDLHNPNVIRASLGALFAVPVVESPSADTISWLRENNIRLIAISPDAPASYFKTDLAGPVAIVMGSEAHGLGQAWLDAADAIVSIPMHGAADSLNLSTATALLLYEGVRQRTFKAD